MLGAVLIDIDYLVDWSLHGGRENYESHIVRPLHGWEFPALLAVSSCWGLLQRKRRNRLGDGQERFRSPFLDGLCAGWACHMALDYLVSRPSLFRDGLVTVRLSRGFRIRAPGRSAAPESHRPRANRMSPAKEAVEGAAIVGLAASAVLELIRAAGDRWVGAGRCRNGAE
jgi:hypothetical protein